MAQTSEGGQCQALGKNVNTVKKWLQVFCRETFRLEIEGGIYNCVGLGTSIWEICLLLAFFSRPGFPDGRPSSAAQPFLVFSGPLDLLFSLLRSELVVLLKSGVCCV
jgi:hypothetical protein